MLPSEAEEAGLWSAIAEGPQDEVLQLIFADWLKEHNDPRGPLLWERHYREHSSIVAIRSRWERILSTPICVSDVTAVRCLRSSRPPSRYFREG